LIENEEFYMAISFLSNSSNPHSGMKTDNS